MLCAEAETDLKSTDRQRKPANEGRPPFDGSAGHEGSLSMSAVDAVLGDGLQDLGMSSSCCSKELVGTLHDLCDPVMILQPLDLLLHIACIDTLGNVI